MYKTGNQYDASRPEMIAFMKAHEFALVTGRADEFPVASQLPLELREESGEIFLYGHLMRKTDHHLAFEKSPQVLAVFYSPHAWVTAEWYTNKATGSTVNYMAVHAKGTIEFLDEEATADAVKRITDRYIGKGTPASFESLPAEYVARLVKAIAGFRIAVTDLQAVFKLSQDRIPVDALNIIRQLEQRSQGGDAFIAQEMKKIHGNAS